jgi:hypothetical protein
MIQSIMAIFDQKMKTIIALKEKRGRERRNCIKLRRKGRGCCSVEMSLQY